LQESGLVTRFFHGRLPDPKKSAAGPGRKTVFLRDFGVRVRHYSEKWGSG
jgi:hypothetical protein